MNTLKLIYYWILEEIFFSLAYITFDIKVFTARLSGATHLQQCQFISYVIEVSTEVEDHRLAQHAKNVLDRKVRNEINKKRR